MEHPRQPVFRLNKNVDISSLVAYRIAFGFCMALHAFHYYPDEKIVYDFCLPKYFFSFSLFEWLSLPVLSPAGFYSLFTAMGVAAFGVMTGLFYRLSLAVLLVTQLYVVLLEKSYTPDPQYLYILVTFLMFFVSADRSLSVDALINPRRRTSAVAFWQVAILRAQFLLVYFFSGFSKLLHPDWLQAKQLSLWLPRLSDTPLIGPLFLQKWFAYFFSWGGMLFDLTAGFLLLNKTTRPAAIVLAVLFHAVNKEMLGLYLVPWFVLAGTIVFLEPDTPRKIGLAVGRKFFGGRPSLTGPAVTARESPPGRPAKALIYFFMLYFIIQILLPFRPLLYPGSSSWTREGLRFSWHLMNDSFKSRMTVYYSPPENDLCADLAPFNEGQAWWMSGNPEMILQYVNYVKKELARCGVADPAVYIDSRISLNGRDYYPLIDPGENLAHQNYPFGKTPRWVLPHPDRQARTGAVWPVPEHEGLARKQLKTSRQMKIDISRE